MNQFPLHLDRNYEYFSTVLEGQACLLALTEDTEQTTPLHLKKDLVRFNTTLHAKNPTIKDVLEQVGVKKVF